MASMNGILIFDEMNDVLYTKFDDNFRKHLLNLATDQGYISPEASDELNNDMLIQIFSPIITSQRIMSTQFGNSYRCIQCEDGLNIVFNEYLGYLFFIAGRDETEYLHRLSGICVTIVKHLCAGDLSLFKTKEHMSSQLSELLDKWSELFSTEQSFLLDCTERLLVNSDLGTATQKALKEATDNLSKRGGHSMIFVGSKFLSLFSSVNSYPLTAADLLFLNLFSQVATAHSHKDNEPDSLLVETNLLFLGCGNHKPRCVPHIVHSIPLSPLIRLILITELVNHNLASNIHETFLSLNLLKLCLQQRELDLLKPAYENLDACMKQINDCLRRIKSNDVQLDNQYKNLLYKWNVVKRKFQEYFKSNSVDFLISIDSLMSVLWDALRILFYATCFSIDQDVFVSNKEKIRAIDVGDKIKSRLSSFVDFFEVKSLRNMTLHGSNSGQSINKYLEEFPGLVHFLHIDRTNNRLTAPSLDFTQPQTLALTKDKIWSMVQYTRRHLSRGQSRALVWKDTVFCYSWFLWFEDSATGAPLECEGAPPNKHELLAPLAEPGVLCGDFYQKLLTASFPNTKPNSSRKPRCRELYSIHLGLTTARCALEHARRLAATVWELTGAPLAAGGGPLDLFA